MGKASSNKKVARAAGTGGGRTYRGHTPWTYFGVIALIVVLGIVGTVTSRDHRLSAINGRGNTAPTVGTTWHEGYAVYICGKFVPAITHAADPQGITTKTPGVILIQPKVKAAAGKNATLGKFVTAAGIKLNAAELQLPGGKLYQDGNSCEGKPGHIYVKEFGFVGDTVGKLFNGAKGQLPKYAPTEIPLQDGLLLTVAFVPSSDSSKIPAPPAEVNTALAQQSSSSSGSSGSSTPATTQPSSSGTK